MLVLEDTDVCWSTLVFVEACWTRARGIRCCYIFEAVVVGWRMVFFADCWCVLKSLTKYLSMFMHWRILVCMGECCFV